MSPNIKPVLPFDIEHQGACYQLREMMIADIPQLRLIEQDSHISPWSDSHFQSSIQSSHHCFVLSHKESDGRNNKDSIVAYCIISTAADEAELLNITVAKNVRRRGLARVLIEFLCQYVDPHIENLFLEVRESNHSALSLYESLDFHVLGQRPNYYPAKNAKGREDALIMAKTLR